jgi:ankyrin repeat protein
VDGLVISGAGRSPLKHNTRHSACDGRGPSYLQDTLFYADISIMSQYSYPPLRSEHNSIRLLRLLPSEDDAAPIQCELFEYTLHDSRSHHLYEALSYVWGDLADKRPILMHGHIFSVTVNLQAALLRLRNHAMQRVLWIDAICINQDDQEEKAYQIQAMANIYGKANRVVVWLGEAADDSEKAFEDIRIAGEDTSAFSSSARQNGDKSINEPMLALLRRPWFYRIWVSKSRPDVQIECLNIPTQVLQEIGAARHVLVACGSEEIDGYAFCSGLGSWYDSYDERQNLQSTITSVSYLMMSSIFRPRGSSQLSRGICTLGELLDMYHSREASLRHDKVYALLGMSSDGMSETSLSPNYAMPWKDLFGNLIKFLLHPGVQVGVSPTDEHTLLIEGPAYMLGSITCVQSNKNTYGRQDVQVSWKAVSDVTGHSQMPGEVWALRTSAKLVTAGDIVCLFQGASHPTIIRVCENHCEIVQIAPTAPRNVLLGKGHVIWSEFEHLARSLATRHLQCVWNWEASPRDGPILEGFEKSGVDISMVRGLWNLMLISVEFEMSKKAEMIFQKLMWAYKICEDKHLRQTIADQLHGTSIIDFSCMKKRFSYAPLAWASQEGSMAIFDLLLNFDEHGVNWVDRTQHTPLTSALKNGHLVIVERLLREKPAIDMFGFTEQPDTKRTALQIVSEQGNYEFVQKLLEEGANVNKFPAVMGGRTALQAASGSGHIEIVERLLIESADVNAAAAPSEGRTALQAAAEGGHVTIVERLLQEGADVNAEPGWGHGRTALQAAVQGGHIAISERLLEAKADVNALPAIKGGITALHAAVRGGHLEIVDRLLQEGVDVHADDKEGRTALHVATATGHLKILEQLLEAQSNVHTIDKYGKTALQIAVEESHFEITRQLLQAGADVDSASSWARSTLEDPKVEAGSLPVL